MLINLLYGLFVKAGIQSSINTMYMSTDLGVPLLCTQPLVTLKIWKSLLPTVHIVMIRYHQQLNRILFSP